MITKRATKHIVATLIIAAVISGSFFAEGLGREEFFDTKNFNVEAELLSSNTLHVKETIVVDFKLYRHGIYRTIPYKGVFRMVKDGKTIEENVRAKISDIDVKGRNFEKEKEDGILKLRIGDEDSYVKGLQTYEISYKVQFYESSIKDFDFFYFNILPHRWPTAIEKARVNMVYPKKVPVDKMSVIVGSDGLRDNISLQENSSGKVYWNYSFKNLTTGVTIHNYLPRNYFRNVPEISRFNFPVKAASLLALILSFLLWLLFGRDPKTIKTVELKPPENMDPMEMAFQLKGKLDGKDVTSEIIYLADKGYITIEERGKKHFLIRKEREMNPGEKNHVQSLFSTLFSVSEQVDISNAAEGLWEDVYDAMKGARTIIADSFSERVSRASYIARTVIFISILGTVVMNVACTYFTPGSHMVLWIMAVAAGILFMSGSILLAKSFDMRDTITDRSFKSRMFAGIIIMLAGGGVMAVLSILTWEDIAAAVAVTLSMIVVALFMTIAEKQNKETVQKRGKILGFKEFLELAEADKMKALVAEDPQYFFNILPFAFVMGFSEKWIKKFDSVITVAPSWYVGSGDLDGMSYSMIHMYSMMWLMNNNINSGIVMAETAAIGENLSSMSSGGGFGGGGFGGGGGGSW